MTVKKKKNRRSDVRIMSKEAMVLKHLRESKKLSVRKAAFKIGISDTKLSHSEHGRCDLNPRLILKILQGYGYTYGEFLKLLSKDLLLPSNDYAECLEILKRIDKSKLATVKTILMSL